MITPEQSAAYNAAKGAAGEQGCDGECDDARCEDCNIVCACVAEFLYGVDPHCPACDGTGLVEDRNTWCDRCGLTGACPDCDGDAYDRANDR